MEAFSAAYARAIVASAGFNVYRYDIDDDSIDLGVAARGTNGTVRSPRLEIQLKCTARLPETKRDSQFSFPLKRKNYDDLRDPNRQVPTILVVVRVPADATEWVEQTTDSVILRHTAHWKSLRGLEATTNRQSVNIGVPASQILSPLALTQIMGRLSKGGLP